MVIISYQKLSGRIVNGTFVFLILCYRNDI